MSIKLKGKLTNYSGKPISNTIRACDDDLLFDDQLGSQLHLTMVI